MKLLNKVPSTWLKILKVLYTILISFFAVNILLVTNHVKKHPISLQNGREKLKQVELKPGNRDK